MLDYTIDTSGTPDQVNKRRAYAETLLKQGNDFSPVQSPWQGAARLAAGLLGGIERGAADRQEQQGRSAWQQRMVQTLQGGKIDPTAMVGLASDPWANQGAISAANTAYTAQHQAERDKINDAHWSASYGLQQRADRRSEASAARANMTPAELAQERLDALGKFGMDATSPENKAWALTGKMPDPNSSTPNSALEYNFYLKTFKPSAEAPQPMDYATFSTAKARAGATNISNNVDLNSGQTYDKQLAEGLGKSHTALATGVEDSQARARDIAAMQGAIDAIQKNGGTTGGLAPQARLDLQKTINAGAAAVGIEKPFSEADLSDKEFLTKFNRSMAGAQAKAVGGNRVTNFEMANFLKANPGLDMTITGNQRLLGIQAQMEQRNIAIGNAIRDETARAISKGKKIDPVTVQKIITDYDEAHHITDPMTGQDLTQSYVLPEFQQQGTNPDLSGRHEKNMQKIRTWDPATGVSK